MFEKSWSLISFLFSSLGSSSRNHMNTTDASPSQSGSLEAPDKTSPPVASIQPPENPDTSSAADGSKKHLLAPAASRSSSKVDKQSTLDNAQETTKNDSENTLRGSKRSILKGRRDRSRGSSRRSRRQNADSASMENRKTPTNPEESDAAKPEKKGKVSYRIFAFLSCCSSSNDDPDDPAIPAKRSPKRQPAPNRQPTPEKAEATPGDQNTTESKEPDYYEEKPDPTVTSDQSPSHVDEEPNAAQLQGEGSRFDGISGSGHDPANIQKGSNEGQNATDASQNASRGPTTDTEKDEGSAQKSEEHATPTVPGKLYEDSTTDPSKATARPIDGTDSKDDTSHNEDATRLPAELPPPPPVAPPLQEGNQQWLLPPIRPQLKNRKCLVLDLDETLVHSSFKVCSAVPRLYCS